MEDSENRIHNRLERRSLEFRDRAEAWVKGDELLVNEGRSVGEAETRAVCPHKVVVQRPFLVEDTTHSNNFGTSCRMKPLGVFKSHNIMVYIVIGKSETSIPIVSIPSEINVGDITWLYFRNGLLVNGSIDTLRFFCRIQKKV